LSCAYRLIFQLLPLTRHSSPRQPAPASQPSPWSMKDPEIITITHTRHASNNAPLVKEARADVACGWDAAKKAAVESVEGEAGAGEDESWGYVLSGGEELIITGGEEGRPIGGLGGGGDGFGRLG
jgi:hypothetical protein